MIKTIWKSFYDANAYAEALKTWRFKFFIYYLLICLIFAIVSAFPTAMRVNRFLAKNAETIASQIPEGKIKDGRFVSESDKPHFITLPDGSKPFAFTSGLLDSSQTDGLWMSLEKDRITLYSAGKENYLFLPEVESEINRIKKIQNPDADISQGIEISGAIFLKMLRPIQTAVICTLPVMFFISGAFMLIMITFALSLPAFILSLSRLPELGYLGCLKISLIAATPAMMLFALGWALGYTAAGGFLYMLVCFIIIWRVMRKLGEARVQK